MKEGNFMDMIRERTIMREFEQSIINDWRSAIGHKQPLGYWYNYGARNLVLYTDSPGQLIGKSGSNVAMLRNLLAEKLIGNWTVEFAEIKGGFVL
jgi:hypothetical protein